MVDICVFLTWTFLLGPMVVLLALPWRRLLSTERALLLLGVGLVMALLTVAFERWRQRGERAQRFRDELTTMYSAETLSHSIPIDRRERVAGLANLGYLGEPGTLMTNAQWRSLEQICR